MKEQYLQSVRKLLDCPRGEKERLLLRLDRALTTYLEDFPEAGNTDLTANFGTPDECAVRLLEECTPATIAAQRKKMARRQRILTTALAILLAVALCVAGYLWSNGGLVIIKLDETLPDYIRLGQVTYNYID